MDDLALRLRLLSTDKLWTLFLVVDAEWKLLEPRESPTELGRGLKTEVFLLHGRVAAELLRRGITHDEIALALDKPRA